MMTSATKSSRYPLKLRRRFADSFIMMVKIALLILAAVTVSFGQSSQPEQGRAHRLWISSMVAVAGATAFDAGTSFGKMESNGFLASDNGTFGTKGISLKAAMTAAVLIPQFIIGRHHPELMRRFTIANFAETGVYTGIAVHNTSIH